MRLGAGPQYDPLVTFVNKCSSCGSIYAGASCPGCGGKRAAIASSSKDLAIPGYEILEELGRGGMGVVYRARQASLDRVVALKVLPADRSRDPEFQERFDREAKAMAALSHPNIVPVFDSGEVDGRFFFSMELIEGTSLRAGVKRPPEEAARIVSQICDALEYAHGRGVIHRDIKPDNILIEPSGRIRIADFGLAKFVTGAANLTGTGAQLGTACYMAPEQMDDPGSVDARADLFAVGVMLYEMVTGTRPVGRFEPPPAFADVVSRAMSRDRSKRFASAAELRAALQGPRRRRNFWPWLAVPALLLAIPLLWWAFPRKKVEDPPKPSAEAPLDLMRVRFDARDMSTSHMTLTRIPQTGDTAQGREEIAKTLEALGVPARAAEVVDGYAAAWPNGTIIAVESPEAERMQKDFHAMTENVYRWSIRRGARLVMVFSGPPQRDAFVGMVRDVQRKLGLPEQDPD